MVVLIIMVALIAVLAVFYYSTPLSTNDTTPIVDPNVGEQSFDWAGYVVATDLTDPRPLVTSVSASWTVPEVNISADDTFSAVWIGVGGKFDSSLIQAGTEQDSIGGQRYYAAWYEMLPADSVTIDALAISPGDRITATITLLGASSTWSIMLRDDTTGDSFQSNFAYASSQLTAEWIVERPTVNNNLGNLANFGEVSLTNCSSEIDNADGAISSFPYVPVSMFDLTGQTALVEITPLSTNGTSFSAISTSSLG